MADTDLYIRLYIPGRGKRLLTITPKFLFASDKKPGPSKPHGFCEYLRKHLHRARIISIAHVPGQRIIDITFQNEQSFHLYIEFFTTGNIILTNNDRLILGCLHRQDIKTRTIKPGIPYAIDERKELLAVNHDELINELTSSDEPASKILATYAGRNWAMEICTRAHTDPNTPARAKKEAEHIAHTITSIRDTPINASIYRDGTTITDITPFPFTHYRATPEHAPSLLDAYERAYLPPLIESDPQDKKLTSITQRIDMQLRRKEQLLTAADEDKRKGELIYEHYTELHELLTAINAARKKLTWAEIKEKLIDHPLVKKIDEKNGKITIEL